MKKALSLAILFALFPGVAAVAQATWNGLRFGMGPKEAESVMAVSKTGMYAPDPQRLVSSNDFDLKLANVTMSFPLKVELDFDSEGLDMIVLRLDVQEFRGRNPDVTSDAMAVFMVGKFAFGALRERYGAPSKQQDDCDPHALTWEGCSADWSVDGVAIGYVVTSIGSANGLLIQYNPIQNAL